MSTLRVRGASEPVLQSSVPPVGEFGSIVKVTPGDAVRVGVRSGEVKELQVAEDDVVELELEGGVRIWTSVDRLHDLLEASGQRNTRGGELHLPPRLQLGPASRGVGGRALQVLKILKVDVAGMASREIAERLEAQLKAKPGLYHCASVEKLEKRVTSPGELPGGAPLLVFLHGTASSTSGSFGAFAATKEGAETWDKLSHRYGGNVFAFEHRSLSLSPIENALELAELLPDRDAVLHLVSHSRGGLIGELLCRGRSADGRDPFDAAALARFAGDARRRDREALEELGEVLRKKRPRVERFVRVACPARGTTLASGRVDLYLSMMLNALGLIPGLRANPVYEFTSALVLAVAKKRTDPRELPGLEAMMPVSPLIAVLNDPGFRVDADLSSIAGDTQGTGLLGRLKVLATDLFYRENHDLVVHTSSMVGGTTRTGGSRLFFAKGSEVSHFQYFRNPDTADRLYRGLARADGDTAGYEPVVESTAERLKTRAPAPHPGTRPVVFVIPGMMGTELHAVGRKIWIDPVALAAGDLPALAVDAPDVKPAALLSRPYARLIDFLSASYEVVEFPFDWRRSVADSADLLAEAVRAKLGETSKPVSFVAHSVGGLVARAMIARAPELWRKVTEREGARLLMMGTPHDGSYGAVRMLVGQERIVRYLAMLDGGVDPAAPLAQLSRFPGILEMLPSGPEGDFLDGSAWRELAAVWKEGWVEPKPEALEGARGLRALLAKGVVDGRRMMNVAGQAPATPAGYRVATDREGAARIEFLATARGDGRVPWSSTELPGVKTWYMEVPHGNLADHPAAFPALRELLETGTTSLLPGQPRSAAPGVAEQFVLPADEPFIFPDAAELEAAAVGMELAGREEAEEAPLEVAVVHGNLAFARHPVAVGHYTGDILAGAEKVLDHHLHGRLAERRHLGIYPGPIGTSDVFLTRGEAVPGGIVVGLGDVGKLTGATLERSFTQAVLSYAARLGERDEGPAPRSASLTALLVGSGRGGISTEDSVRAIVRATLRAREMLRSSELRNPVRIDRLEFCELYEDVAITALRIVRRLAGERGPGGGFQLKDELVCRTGGRRRASFEEMPDWWDRLQVSEHADDGLAFLSLTERARAEKQSISQQRTLMDRFLASAVGSVADTPALSKTLFELLIPNDLKDYAPDRNNLVLIVDSAAARYPWELLRDEAPQDREPPAVRRGLVRQFQTASYRTGVRAPMGNGVLVVGDPRTTTFPPLAGAAREAEEVAELFGASAGFEVTSLVRGDFPEIVQALYARSYRVMHMAAHGVFEYPLGDGTVTGMVLGDDAYLRPAELDQIRSVPELVFLNCCHLGKIEPERAGKLRPGYPLLAANLAEQLIRTGVRAVVAAGWEVEDDAALTFARTFYDQMLGGRSFGEAVWLARREAYFQHPGINTWGAYQCYGDPGYVLATPSGALYTAPAALDFTCSSEVELELANLAEDASATAQHRAGTLERRLDEIVKAIPEEWKERPRVIAALARAHADLGRFDDAIEWYQKLEGCAQAEYTVQALEQLANMRVRRAMLRWLEDGAIVNPESPQMAEVRKVIGQLMRLPGRRPRSSERSSLLGSAYKRLSWMSAGDERAKALARMEAAYRAAYGAARETALARGGRVNVYPLHNLLSAAVVRRLLGLKKEDTGEIRHWVMEAEEATAHLEATQADFWSGIGLADLAVVTHLNASDLDNHADEIARNYARAWRRGGQARQLSSVLEHMGWLIAMLAADGGGGEARESRVAAQVAALRTIERAVRALQEGSADA
ncbi:MAG TPA: CHAT domain-containing protein [Longimicrobium sp.]|jgi:tetratricopeptide (TPR) repeat protein